MAMKRAEIAAFLARDWSAVAASKVDFWTERKRTMTADELFSLAEGMRRHVLELRPDWPSDRERAADLDAHQRSSERLRHADSGARR